MTRERPYTLIAELTYRCPLHCPYCSNPTDYGRQPSLKTHTWRRLFREAEALGIVQLHLTGGEPLLRDDLEELVRTANELDLYTNLITSGIPLDQPRLDRHLPQRGVPSDPEQCERRPRRRFTAHGAEPDGSLDFGALISKRQTQIFAISLPQTMLFLLLVVLINLGTATSLL